MIIQHLIAWYSGLCMFLVAPFSPAHVVDAVSHILTYKCVESGFLFACLCLVSMPPLPRKRTRRATPAASTAASPTTPTQTPTKKPRVAAPPTPVKGKAATFVYRAIAGSSRPVPLNSRPSQVEFPPLDQVWLVFGDLDSSQYLKNATTPEEYARLVKYFHGRLVLVVRGLHLPEVRAIFRATLPAWYNSADTDIQDDMEVQFESAYDWANQEVVKKIRSYSYAWTQTPAGKAYESAWLEAK